MNKNDLIEFLPCILFVVLMFAAVIIPLINKLS